MKKIIAALALGAAFPVMASGVYVGGQLGMSGISGTAETGNQKLTTGKSSFIGGAFLGYQVDLDSAFVAVEGDFNFGSSKSEAKLLGITEEVKRGNTYGLSAIVGTSLDQSVDVYGRLGWARTKFKDSVVGGVSADTSENGIAFGGGMRYNMNEQMALRLDYRYIKYSSFKFFENGADVKANDQQFTVGLQYAF